jgi:hypothetical protein
MHARTCARADLLQIFTKDQIAELMKEIDADGDKHVDFFEYVFLLHELSDPAAIARRRKKMDTRTAAMFSSLQVGLPTSKACAIQ